MQTSIFKLKPWIKTTQKKHKQEIFFRLSGLLNLLQPDTKIIETFWTEDLKFSDFIPYFCEYVRNTIAGDTFRSLRQARVFLLNETGSVISEFDQTHFSMGAEPFTVDYDYHLFQEESRVSRTIEKILLIMKRKEVAAVQTISSSKWKGWSKYFRKPEGRGDPKEVTMSLSSWRGWPKYILKIEERGEYIVYNGQVVHKSADQWATLYILSDDLFQGGVRWWTG